MNKEAIILIVIALAFSSFTLFEGVYKSNIPLVGHAVSGAIGLYVSGSIPLDIHSPLNATYNFAIGSNFTLDLNVSTPNAGSFNWKYSLENIAHGTTVESDVPFTPNSTFNAVRKSNRLTVTVDDGDGNTGVKSVVFFVSVPNSAPLLGNISSQIYACENTALLYMFNATDADEDDLQVSLSPTSPFFAFPSNFFGQAFIESQIFSGVLSKANVGSYTRTVSVTDGQYSDSKQTNITVIPVNNAPQVETIGAQTLYLQGEGTQLDRQINVTDVEDGNQNGGQMHFNISFNGGPTLFNISANGTIKFIANLSYLGVHNITYCVQDNPLQNIHPNISLCGSDGSAIAVCSNFSLTVTDTNRAPTIIDHYPAIDAFNATANVAVNLNITTYDPDGTVPDVRWYADGSLVSYQQGNTVSALSYAFPCGISGARTLSANITDGLATDSFMWNVELAGVDCPAPTSSAGGGGGGGGGFICTPKWGCSEWGICQNAKRSLEVGILAGEDWRLISEACAANRLDDANCGFQIRTCFDGGYCNSTRLMPDSTQFCEYSANPSCNDGIKNCHGGSCELLVDCGGACGPCPSCSDGIQNQGELDVDCGGPCPFQCKAETPLVKYSVVRTVLIWLFWIILTALLALLVSRIIKLIRVHNEIRKERRIQSALSR